MKDTADIIPLHGIPEEDYDYPSYVGELFDDEDDNESYKPIANLKF